jgi:hypothetical protein
MLIMALLVLGIGFLQNVMNLLLNVLDSLKKFGFSINLGLSMGGLFYVQLQWEELRQWGPMVFGIVHPHDMDNHLVDYLYLSISLWVEGNQFGQIGVHH